MDGMNSDSTEMALLPTQIESAKGKLRDLCEAENMLSIYEEVDEHFFGENAYIDYSLEDWLENVEFQREFADSSLAYYQISLVMAHLVGAHDEGMRGQDAAARERLEKANILTEKFLSLLPEIYGDLLVRESSAAQCGGLTKNINRKCRSILGCLKTYHDLKGVDLKSSDEVVSRAIDMMIYDERIEDVKITDKLIRFYPYIFRQWLSVNLDEADLFKEYTGISWDE